jgi:Zn-dependent oligopeptidase
MKPVFTFLMLAFLIACNQGPETDLDRSENPFFTELGDPIQYATVTHQHIEEYANITLKDSEDALDRIKTENSPDFENIFVAFDDVINEINKTSSNCFMLYWVSPDSLSRDKGLAGYQKLDSLGTSIFADSALYNQMLLFTKKREYDRLEGHRKVFVDDVMLLFEYAGVNLDPVPRERYKNLSAEISDLSSQYSINMNTANEILVLDEAGTQGLTDKFKDSHRVGDSKYEIPVIPANRQPILNNASVEQTRKLFMMKYQNRASDKNLEILDDLVSKRHELAQLMDYDSYASYRTTLKMAKNPENVWNFLNDLIDRSKDKAIQDHETLKNQRNLESGTLSTAPLNPWDVGYYRNQLLKIKFQVDQEKVREYLPMEQCLTGMFDIFQELLGVEIRKIESPSVWHEEVVLYEVWEEGSLKGRFYLDLYPRPNKESWFYGVGLTQGKLTEQGYEIPACLLLGNFTAPTETIPSLLSHDELSTLFHEFGHIMDNMCYNGEFSYQANTKDDFGEAMSQIFENWIWDYEMFSTFARHYKSGEILPKELFDNMLKAKNITSGLDAQRSLRNCVYDMMLYDAFDPNEPKPTDDIWLEIDQQLALSMVIEGTHPQASWIHINTHPTYYYGYLWAEVYAQDMFKVFKENGLKDTPTGIKYRKLILANGTQRDITEAVEEFLGRPSNNEAYINSLGLD